MSTKAPCLRAAATVESRTSRPHLHLLAPEHLLRVLHPINQLKCRVSRSRSGRDTHPAPPHASSRERQPPAMPSSGSHPAGGLRPIKRWLAVPRRHTTADGRTARTRRPHRPAEARNREGEGGEDGNQGHGHEVEPGISIVPRLQWPEHTQ